MSEKEKRPGVVAAPESSEDTRAILSRRAFLIKSALVGMGVAAVASGCGDDPKRGTLVDQSDGTIGQPDACLSVDVVNPDDMGQPCLGRLPEDLSDGTIGQPDACLSVDVVNPDDMGQPCLGRLPEDLSDGADLVDDELPQVCLEPRPADTSDAEDDLPQVCLDPRPDDINGG